MRSLSRELAELRINVNAVAPGLIATPMTQKRLDDPAAQLVEDSGFEPVDAGPLAQAPTFDLGAAYNHPMPAAAMRRILGLE